MANAMKHNWRYYWRYIASEIAYKWWQVRNPRAAYLEWRRLRRARKAARARFEAFKAAKKK